MSYIVYGTVMCTRVLGVCHFSDQNLKKIYISLMAEFVPVSISNDVTNTENQIKLL